MNKTYSNRCPRCGRERIVSNIWEEKIGSSVVLNTEKICPDKDCQKELERENKKQSDKIAAMKVRSLERAVERKEANRQNRLKKKKT